MGRRLTQKAAEKFTSTKKRREIPDGLIGGLYLVVQPSGRKSWAVRGRINGKHRKFTLGAFPAVTLAQARDKARTVLEIKDRGEDPAVVAAVQKAEIKRTSGNTFEAVATDFIERYAKPKNKSWQVTDGALKRHAMPYWRKRPIGSITRHEVVTRLDEIAEKHGPYAANRTLAAIRKLFNWHAARDEKFRTPIVMAMARGESKRDRVLTDDELKAIWNGFDTLTYPWNGYGKMLILTAQRRGEVASMEWNDIDIDKRLWVIPADKTKGDRTHTVPLSTLAITVLKNTPRIDGQGFVFSARGKAPGGGFSMMKRRLADKVDVRDWRLHDLRRTAATGLRTLGVDRLTVSKILNHAESGVTAVYDRHAADKEKRQALDVWSRHVERLVSGKVEKVVRLRP